MKVGVAIPVRNAMPFIENTMFSVLAQTYAVSAYLVDDASDDDTWEFITGRWGSQVRVRSDERRGWPATLNHAVGLAIDDGCEAVFLLNADDWLRLDCIEKCVDKLDKGYDWVVVNSQQIGEENVVQRSMENASIEDFMVRSPIVNYALIRSNQWKEVGGYSLDIVLSDSYGNYEDWEFWIKMFKAGYSNYAVVEDPVYFNRMHDKQLHKIGLDRVKEQRELIKSKHSELPWELGDASWL